MSKILQRDANLARKTGALIKELLEFQDYTLDPAADDGAKGKNINYIAPKVLDFFNELHWYNRQATPIELKGQRG